MKGLEVDLKGEAIGQMSGECQSDLEGEIEVTEEVRHKPKAWAEVAS